ncbi:hypothetical protein [Sulfitobacter faviae]|uniref:hypothetical protein n=1 Tax=Sulfitobacter faviae TaxID=1775881 RepID=UPI00398D0005
MSDLTPTAGAGDVIRDAENALFEEWRTHSPKMVTDGAANADIYAQSDIRILLVLKEVNDPGGGGWDLRKFIRNGGRSQTWNNVSRWVRGIRAMPQDLTWDELEPVSTDDRRDLLASIAAINLKKEPGGHTSVAAEIADAASARRSLLRRQFSIYEPDLVICCGTASWAVSALLDEPKAHWQRTTRGVRYCRTGDGATVIDFSHPEARCPNPFIVYGLLDAVREIGILKRRH